MLAKGKRPTTISYGTGTNGAKSILRELELAPCSIELMTQVSVSSPKLENNTYDGGEKGQAGGID